MTQPSKACCTVPPVKADYTPKGTWINVQKDMKTYKTGDSNSSKAVLIIGDIFGVGPQVQQGADILAHAGYQVYVPDFLRGKYADHSWFPVDTAEKGKAIGAFFKDDGNIAEKGVKVVPGVLKDLNEESKGTIKKWAAVGLCWGAKVATLDAGSNSPFTAIVSAHPTAVDAKDAPNVKIPIAFYPSMHEDEKDCKAFVDGLTVPKDVHTFSDASHGWMAARADFKDPKQVEQFTEGYQRTINFLEKHF